MKASAFLLAAGFGTRLRPLTNHRPKPLVPLCGLPLADYSLALLEAHGLKQAVVNAHHLPDQIHAWAETHTFDLRVVTESPSILGTGGGLRNARDFLQERFVVVNGDILCDVNLTALLQQVNSFGQGPAGAMALREQKEDESYGIVASDVGGCVVDLVGLAQATPAGQVDRSTHFTGIHSLNQEALELVGEGEACIVRSAYCDLVPKRRVGALKHAGLWVDLGNPQRYLAANLGVLSGSLQCELDPLFEAGWALSQSREGGHPGNISLNSTARLMAPFWIGEGAEIGPNSQLGPGSIVGAKAHIGAGAKLRNCVVWDGVNVPPDSVLENCIVHDGGVLKVPNT